MTTWLITRFSNLSIRGKLVVVILASTLPPLIVGFSYVVLTDLRQFRVDLIERSDLVTHTVSSYLAVGLAFEDHKETQRGMEPLQALDQTLDVYVYDNEGRLFERYHRFGTVTEAAPPAPTTAFTEIRDGFVLTARPVIFDGQRWGTVYVRSTAAPLTQRIRAYQVRMTLLGAALVLLSVLGAYVCQGPISRPITRLVEAARRISDEGDYSVRVEKQGTDEIGTLYDSFNTMVEKIERRQDDLERSNRDLDQFAYVASHDLKAPLRAISTLSAWIEEDLDDQLDGDSREQMRLLRGRVARMDRLIEGILQYSRVGRIDSAGETVHLGEMLAELVGFLDRPDGLEIEIAPDMPTLVARRLRLEQVFQNLISNAIKYHHQPEQGHVWIRAVERDHEIELSIADDGPGIEPKYHARIFQMFQTLRPRDEVESTGLGLSLVTKLVEEEGGTVWVDSDRGRGATFSFTWPKTPPSRQSAARRADVPAIATETDMLGRPDSTIRATR